MYLLVSVHICRVVIGCNASTAHVTQAITYITRPVFVRMCVCSYICMCVCVCVCLCAYVRMFVCAYVRMCVCVRIFVCVYV